MRSFSGREEHFDETRAAHNLPAGVKANGDVTIETHQRGGASRSLSQLESAANGP